MAELLIIIGMSGVILCTLGLMQEASGRGQSALFFLIPLASLPQVQQNWGRYRWWALARVASLFFLAVGSALLWMNLAPGEMHANDGVSRSGQVLRGDKTARSTQFVSSQQAALLAIKGQGKPLAGRLHGHSFKASRVALINGALTLSQGDSFLPPLEVKILLGWDPQAITERREILIDPSDPSGPVVHLSWKPKGRDYPETRIFQEGYRLDLALAPLDNNQLSGSLTLVMPDTHKSYFVGDFTAHTNNLRYDNGQVDLRYDHEDTLAFVTQTYLRTQFPKGALQTITVRNVQMRRAKGRGQVVAHVELTNGALEERQVVLQKSQVGWSVKPGSMETRVVTPPREGSMELVDWAAGKAVQPPPEPEPDRRLSFAELGPYQGRQVSLETHSGRQLDGVIRKIAIDRLWLAMNVGSGTVERTVSRQDLASVTLSDGQTMILVDKEAQQAKKPQTEASADTEVESEAAAQPANEAQLHPLQGKQVTVTAEDGQSRTGVLQSVEQDHITLSVPMGAGTMEYFYDLKSIRNIEEDH